MPDDPTNPAHSPENPLDFEPPSLADLTAALDGFEIHAFLGKGPLGTVYKASQHKLDRTVALKIFPIAVASESAFAKRFQTEAQTMAKLRHDHIMSVHDFGESTDGKWLYIAMEWVAGDTLERALIKQNWDLPRKIAVAAQLCDALNYAHNHGVIHRDLKPGNVMLADEGRAKIADFGMATIVGADSYDTKLTHSTASIGMPDFVAPEQLEPGNPVDHRADIYSVGVILYKMLTGYIPRGTYRPPSERSPGLDPRLDAIVARAMEPDPNQRYQNVSELMDALLDIHANPVALPVATSRLVTGRVPENAGAPRLVTGRIPEKASPPGGAAAMTDTAPVAAASASDKNIAVAVMAIVGSVVLVLAIIGGFLYFNREKSTPQPILASVPQPSKADSAPRPEPPSPPAVSAPRPAAPPSTPQPLPTAATLPAGSTLDLIAVTKPINDKLSGIWVRTSDGLASRDTQSQARLAIPARPAGDYRLLASFTRNAGENSLGFHLPLGDGREVSCFFDHAGTGGSDTSGLEYVDKHDIFNPANPTLVSPGALETGRRYTATVTVRFPAKKTVAIDVLLDGQPYFKFEGERARLSINPEWSQGQNANALGLAVSKSAYTIHELSVEVLGGELALSREAPDSAIIAATPATETPGKPPAKESAPPPETSPPFTAPAIGTLVSGARTGPEDTIERLGPPVPDAAAAIHEQFQKRYDAEVVAAHHREVAALNAKYRAALERSRQAATAKGDLEEVLVLGTEIEALDALERGDPLGAELPGGSPAALIELRQTYRDQIASLDRAREQTAIPVIAAYDQALEALQAKLTRELKIEDALAIKTAREDLQQRSPFGPEPRGAPATEPPTPTETEAEISTGPLFPDNLPAGVIRVAPDGVKIDGAVKLDTALAEAKSRQTIALARGRYEPITIEIENLTLIGNRAAIGNIILAADGITLIGIESDNVSVGGYRGEIPVPVSDIRLEDSRLRSVTTLDGSAYEAFNCIGSFQVSYESSAVIDHCTFVTRGLEDFVGYRLWYGSRVEIKNCVITGGSYIFSTAAEGPESCRIKGSLIFAEKEFLALEVPPTPPATEYTWKPVDRRVAEREHNIDLSGCLVEDPQFIDSGKSDFRLRDTSPGWKADRGRNLGANLDADGWPVPFQN